MEGNAVRCRQNPLVFVRVPAEDEKLVAAQALRKQAVPVSFDDRVAADEFRPDGRPQFGEREDEIWPLVGGDKGQRAIGFMRVGGHVDVFLPDTETSLE